MKRSILWKVGAILLALTGSAAAQGVTQVINPPANVGNATGTLPAANGGTGEAGTITGALKGNGTSAATQAACADLSNGATGCAVAVENGSWTPGIAFGGSSTGVAYAGVTQGRYTHVGNVYCIYGYILLTSKGAQTGNVTITGLPAANFSGGNAYMFIGTSQGLTFSGAYLEGFIGTTAQTVTIFAVTSATGAANVTNTGFTNTTDIAINGCYATS